MAIRKKPVPTRYHIYASYRDRDRPKGTHARRPRGVAVVKRASIRIARRTARSEMPLGVYPRQVSVYAVVGEQSRGRLIYQVHFNSKLKRLISEEL